MTEFQPSAFTTETTAKLTRLSVGQLRYWNKIGFFSPSIVNTRKRYGRIYSYADVVRLRMFAWMREAGVPVRALRVIQEALAQEPLATEAVTLEHSPGILLGEMVVTYTKTERRVSPQQSIEGHVSVVTLDLAVAEVQGSIRALQTRTPEQIGIVSRDRSIMSGVPVLSGTRIPVTTIAWFHRNGYSIPEILAEFPRLTKEDIVAALLEEERSNCAAAKLLAS